jgi:TorA maturation chaperone TorD
MELLRCLGSLIEPPSEETRRLARLLELGPLPTAAEHTDLFLLQLYPFASVYLDRAGKLGGEARDRIAGFWRALEMSPPTEPDHLTVLLAFYSRLLELETQTEGESAARWHHIRVAFLWEHLLSWLPPYLDKMQDLQPPFYKEWADLLVKALTEEVAGSDRPEQLPLHLREAAEMADPRSDDDGAALLSSLLAPVRCGFVLVRDDLQRAGHDLGLGVRAGERSYVLKALLSQDDKATLRWLADEAARWADTHQAWTDITGPIATFWSDRAARAAALLTDLANDI